MNRCLCCQQILGSDEQGYHASCLKELFDGKSVPALPYSTSQIEQLAADWLNTNAGVTGVQPKLSLHWNDEQKKPRLTIIGALEGQYILKAPFEQYPHMPELEALTMNMARAVGIATVPFGLINLKDGDLAFITRRIDREKDKRIAMEDMCQLSERITEHKYHGSHEQIAKIIVEHSKNTILDIVRYYEVVLFSFLVGNNDMHLKNFSLFAPQGEYQLSPAYDLISSLLLLPEDKDDLALTLNGKKRKLNRNDLEVIMQKHLPAKTIENLMDRILKGYSEWKTLIQESFVTKEMRSNFIELINTKMAQFKSL